MSFRQALEQLRRARRLLDNGQATLALLLLDEHRRLLSVSLRRSQPKRPELWRAERPHGKLRGAARAHRGAGALAK